MDILLLVFSDCLVHSSNEDRFLCNNLSIVCRSYSCLAVVDFFANVPFLLMHHTCLFGISIFVGFFLKFYAQYNIHILNSRKKLYF